MNPDFLRALSLLADLNDHDKDNNPEYFRGGKEIILDMFAPNEYREDTEIMIDGYMRELKEK